MQSLTKRIQPVLSGRLFVSDLDPHTRQALDLYAHFRASALIDLPPEKIKAEIEKMPEGVRDLIRSKARRLYSAKFLHNPR